MNILITGAYGFVGTNLINNLKIKIPNGFEYPADVRSEMFISI